MTLVSGCSLFYTAFHDATVHKVSVIWKDRTVCIATAPQALWVLTDQGHIFIRFEISSNIDPSM